MESGTINSLIGAVIVLIVIALMIKQLYKGDLLELFNKILEWFKNLGNKKPKKPEFETIYVPKE